MAAPDSYIAGQVVRISNTFTVLDVNNLPVNTDPTTVVFTVRDPAGNITVYTFGSSAIVKDAVGIYHLDITTTSAGGSGVSAGGGEWWYSMQGTGTCSTTVENSFLIIPNYS